MSKEKKLSKKESKRRFRRRLLVAEVFILVILIGVLYAYSKFEKIDYVPVDEKNIVMNDLDEKTEEILKGYTTVAMFGVDNRTMGDYKTGNSDTIIVMAINNATKEIRMLSVYRDCYLNVYNDTFSKCNAAYNKGGPEAAIEMLNRNLDLNITDFVAVDFKALADAVDAVGGLELEMTSREANEMNKFIGENSKWVGRDSSPVSEGTHTLDGVQTLAYARIRHDSTDFRRAQRQRTVVSKLIEKAKSANISQLNSMVDAIFPEVATSFSIKEILSLATGAAGYHLGDTAGFPQHLAAKDMGKKGDCVIPCTLSSNVSYVHQFLYDEPDYVPTNTVSEISSHIVGDSGLTEKDAVDFGFNNPDGVPKE